MYKVVLIDDEPIIVEGLTRTVPWEKWGCEVVGSANDGLEGIELIRKEKPNIVFSDIAMPGIDGLMMVAALKSEFEDTEFTILTGYRNFDYAQEAIRLGITRFILKPSSMHEIEEAIEKMVANLKKKNIEGAEEEQTGAGSFIVRNALNYMKENYGRKITLSEVAEQTYVSQWHLSKLLNKHTGQSFSELLNSIRINEAKALLNDQSLRISDIAEMVGFLDLAHFSRVFKKHVGVSANEYRNKIR